MNSRSSNMLYNTNIVTTAIVATTSTEWRKWYRMKKVKIFLRNQQIRWHNRTCVILALLYNFDQSNGEVAQWLRRLTANRKVSSLIPDLPTMLRVRDISNLCSHTVHSAECTGNCAWGLNEELPIAAKSWANKAWITLP